MIGGSPWWGFLLFLLFTSPVLLHSFLWWRRERRLARLFRDSDETVAVLEAIKGHERERLP